MGYKKDIFAVFAYEFELLQKMKSVQARMKSAMQMKSSATPQMKLNPHIRRRRRFHPPARVDLVEKPTCRNKSVFFGGDEEDRTLDLTDANRTLSQLSYAPTGREEIEG